MNFEEIRNKMNTEQMDSNQIPADLKHLKSSNMPIQKVRQSMKSEVITQLIIIVLFFAAPSILEMHALPKSLYYIFMFITSLITLSYLIKMSWFLNKTSNLSSNSKDVVVSFISELKLTLEVYKTAIISGSLLLPLSFLTLYFGQKEFDESLFSGIILLDFPTSKLLLYIFGYLALSIAVYFVTVLWTNKLYGSHLENLKSVLQELNG